MTNCNMLHFLILHDFYTLCAVTSIITTFYKLSLFSNIQSLKVTDVKTNHFMRQNICLLRHDTEVEVYGTFYQILKKEKEALKAIGMDTSEIDTKIIRKKREYEEFCKMCGVNPKPSRLRYECGTADLKKTKAWKEFRELSTEKKIDFGNIKNVKFEKTADKTVIDQVDISEIQKTIAELGEEYNIHLDYFEVGNYTDDKYINAPLFFKAINEEGVHKSKLVVNNACTFWMDRLHMENILNSGFFAGNTIKDFTIHEMAHVMTFQNCKTIDEYYRLEKYIRSLYTNGISPYSWQSKDGAETIAEAFVKFRKGRNVNVEARNLLDKYIEVWKND